MTKPLSLLLEYRSMLAATGEDLVPFLQGLITQNVETVSADKSAWSALLTPQGKFLHDFFLVGREDGSLLLDCERERRADLLRRLKLYKLRSKVTLEDREQDYAVLALFGGGALEALGLPAEPGAAKALSGGIAFVDPRLPGMGARAYLPKDNAAAILEAHGFAPATLDQYDALRFEHGIPDGSRDLEVEKSILLENGFDELGGIDWKKGCFIGQELTARTKYRALIKKRLVPVRIKGSAPEEGEDVLHNGRVVGQLRSHSAQAGLALLRLDALEAEGLVCGEATLRPRLPAWLQLQS